MGSKPVIDVLNLSKRYADFQLQINNLKINEGSIVGLVGENGSGKSTFLNLLLNQIKSEIGNVKIFGLDYVKDEYQIKLNLGVILEQNYFPNSFTVQQIEKMLEKIYSRWDKKLYHNLIDEFDLPTNKPISNFSRGMLVKLNFAATLSHHPRLLIADEATSGLDPIIRKEILSLLKEYVSDNQMTVLLSSHILSDLEQVADYFVFIKNGNILLKGGRSELLNHYTIKTEITSLPLKNIKYKLCQDNLVQYLVDVSQESVDYKDYASLEEILLFLVKGVRMDEGTSL
ncbi:ABC transporter ATP-binding protein [Lactobacillus melliventris]|uniref:ABC transporter, ATP-binding protein n=1 Tax=Lactobacillus melliventris TaxID=1218507 RepID=A0A0F4LBR9_9LACO|nr:ABC transporter ATP-binding protein [Lactobacillus melliventris]KJY56302.1 ABC transporter, ATP-binding protein [Lactobacillus melliventris]